jgi:hypothetical protein
VGLLDVTLSSASGCRCRAAGRRSWRSWRSLDLPCGMTHGMLIRGPRLPQ